MKTTYTIITSVDRKSHNIVRTGSRVVIETVLGFSEAERILCMYNRGLRHGKTKNPILLMPRLAPAPIVRKTFMETFPASHIKAAAAYRYTRFGRKALYVGFLAERLGTSVNALHYAFKEINAGKQCG
jgi:hypothetical protein